MYALDRYESIFSWKFSLNNRTAMRIGGSRAGLDPTEPDNSVLKINGKPFIPGSSLKGIFRSTVEALSQEFAKNCFICGAESFKPSSTNRKKFLESLDQKGFYLCPACTIFGNEFIQGRVYFNDAYLMNEVQISIRDGVRIRRDTETAADGAKYDYEIVEPGGKFEGEIILLNTPKDSKEYQLLKQVIEWVQLGIVKIGGSTSRGFGRFEILDFREVDHLEAMKDVR